MTARSAFIDGAPTGTRTLPDGTTIDLDKATNMLDCGKVDSCGDADFNVSTDERPWGMNNPHWKLYAYGPITAMLPTDTINLAITSSSGLPTIRRRPTTTR